MLKRESHQQSRFAGIRFHNQQSIIKAENTLTRLHCNVTLLVSSIFSILRGISSKKYTEEQAPTPPGVEVYTPREQSPTLPWTQPDPSFLYPTIHLPWRQFTGALNNIFETSHQYPLPAAAVAMFHDFVWEATEPGKRIRLTMTGGQSIDREAVHETGNTIDQVSPAAIASVFKRYLPTVSHPAALGRGEQDYDISIRGGQLQLLESIIGLISNNHHSRSLIKAIGTLADNHFNLEFLHRLLSMDYLSIKVLREKLLECSIGFYTTPNLLKTLLKCGADPNHILSDGSSLLSVAISRERSEIIRVLLDAGADVNFQGESDRSPLIRASVWGNDEIVSVLLDLGADINSQDEDGITVLSHAALKCKDDTVLKLLDLGAQHGRRIESLLEMIQNRSRSVVERLLGSLRASPVQSPDIVASFFIHAAWRGDVDTLRLLVTLEFATFEVLRKTPWLLMEAAAFGFVGVFEGGETSEAEAILVIDYLLNHGFHIRSLDKDGRGSPLVYAVLRGRMDLARYLLDAGARTDIFANGEWKDRCPTSDHIISRHYDEIIYDSCSGNELLEGVVWTNREIAPIHAAAIYAASNDHGWAKRGLSITNLLLDHGANPNLAGAVYPIQIAALTLNEDDSVVKRLLEGGANPNFTTPKKIEFSIVDDRDQDAVDFKISMPNALHLALLQGKSCIIEALVSAEAKLPNMLDAIELCTCEDNQRTRKETWREILSRHASSDGRPICPTWTQLSNCDNPVENELCKLDGGGCIREQHDPNRRECLYNYQYWWNPLYGVAEDEELFAKVLKMCSSKQKIHWLTPGCISKVIEVREWESVIGMIDDGTFPGSTIDDEAFFRAAILADKGHWVRRLISRKSSSDSAVQRGFVLATQRHQTNLVEIFLEAGCWPDDKAWCCDGYWFEYERFYKSPLGQALRREESPLVAVFLDYYNRMRYSDVSGHVLQAYGEAIEYGHLALARSLIGSGPVGLVKYSGPVPSSPEIIGRHLVWAKVRSSMQLAIIFRQHDVVDWLLDEGADLNIPAEEQNTITAYHSPLQCAAKSGDTNFVKRLIEKGADVNGVPILVAGATALQFAAMLGEFEMLNILLSAGASINAPPSPWEGRSAIEGAAEQCRTDTVFFLLESGADIQGKMNANYRRTVYRAWAHGHRVLADEIQQWKKKTYGEDDCESIDFIVRSMDMETLGHYGGKFDSFGESCSTCQEHLTSKSNQPSDFLRLQMRGYS